MFLFFFCASSSDLEYSRCIVQCVTNHRRRCDGEDNERGQGRLVVGQSNTTKSSDAEPGIEGPNA